MSVRLAHWVLAARRKTADTTFRLKTEMEHGKGGNKMKGYKVAAGFALLVASCATNASAQIALLDSANTKEFFRRHYNVCPYLLDGEEYKKYFMGWQYALGQWGRSYTLIHDEHVTAAELSKYKVLILSNTASLTEEQSRAIHGWVIRGGKLLATFGSGYKSTLPDPRQDDGLKGQKGHTFGLHELWHDPVSTVFSSYNISPGVDIAITASAGPTACSDLQTALSPGNILDYGAESNVLIQRPENHPSVLGFVRFKDSSWTRPTPAIIVTRAGSGLVIYLSFAPEFIVSLAYISFPNPGCPVAYNPFDFVPRADKAILLMRCTLDWLVAQ